MIVSPKALEAAMSAVDQIRAMLGEDADPDLRLGMIEGETDALALLDRIIEHVLADETLADGARARAKRLEARADRLRAVVSSVLIDKLGVEKLERPLYTASIGHRAKPVVTDATALPEAFVRHAPDMIAIGKALRQGDSVAGAELSNPAPVLTIKRT